MENQESKWLIQVHWKNDH